MEIPNAGMHNVRFEETSRCSGLVSACLKVRVNVQLSAHSLASSSYTDRLQDAACMKMFAAGLGYPHFQDNCMLAECMQDMVITEPESLFGPYRHDVKQPIPEELRSEA